MVTTLMKFGSAAEPRLLGARNSRSLVVGCWMNHERRTHLQNYIKSSNSGEFTSIFAKNTQKTAKKTFFLF